MNEIKVVKVPQYSLLNNALMQMSKQDLNYATSIIDSIIHGPDNSLTEELYLKLLQEVIIRFNTSPKTYEKEDFKKLIQALISAYKISDSLDLQIYDNLSDEIANKVDAEDGKSLMSDLEHSKLANILAGAEVNVQSDWEAESGDALILNKPTKLSLFIDNLGSHPKHTHGLYITAHQNLDHKLNKLIPGEGISISADNVISNTRRSAEWGNITGNILQLADLYLKFNTKVDAEVNKSLMSSDEHYKLSGIEYGAEVNVLSDWLSTTGDSFIKNKPTQLSQFVDNLGSNPTHTHRQYITLHQSLEDCVKFTDEASSLKAGIVKLGDDSILLNTPGYTNCLVQKDSNGVLAVKVPNCDYIELTYDEAMSILNS